MGFKLGECSLNLYSGTFQLVNSVQESQIDGLVSRSSRPLSAGQPHSSQHSPFKYLHKQQIVDQMAFVGRPAFGYGDIIWTKSKILFLVGHTWPWEETKHKINIPWLGLGENQNKVLASRPNNAPRTGSCCCLVDDTPILEQSQLEGRQGDQTSQSWRKSILNIQWKDWC